MTETTSSKPQAPDDIWYDYVEGYSPDIEPSPVSPHMQFSCAAAESPEGDTTALFAGYNLGWPYLELYGGQMPAPINIVATNLLTGQVYFSPSDHSDASLTQPVQLYLSQTEVNAGEPANNRSFVNSWFNADLAQLLCLPPEDGLYGVSLWLDDLNTKVQSVQVTSNQSRIEAPPVETEVTTPGLVTIQASSHSPAAEDGTIRMDGPLQEGGGRIYATLPKNVFSSPPVPIDGGTPVLTLLGFTQKTRQLFWYRDKEFYATAKKSNIFNFDFDPFKLIPRPKTPENLFIISQLGTLTSETTWIPSEQSVET